jgi:hypothetical protein
MKRISCSMIISVGIAVLIFQIYSGNCTAQTPESYPLVCRGGGNSVLAIAAGDRDISFAFARGTKPASKGLAAGECSWTDRAMSGREPNRLSQRVEAGFLRLRANRSLAPENEWFEELRSADRYWTFMVYNDTRGLLIVTAAHSGGIGGADITRNANLPPTGNDIVKIVTLRGQRKLPTRSEVIKGLPGRLKLDTSLTPRPMGIDEQMEVLRSSGWKTLDGKPTPYVTLTPQQPYVADKGILSFGQPHILESGTHGTGIAIYEETESTNTYPLYVEINAAEKGIYFISFSVNDTSEPLGRPCGSDEKCAQFQIELPDSSKQIFQAKGSTGWIIPPYKPQYLSTIINADTPGWFVFKVSFENEAPKSPTDRGWIFWSCSVSVLK